MRKLHILIFLFVVSISASAQTLFWIGGQGDWNDTNHWSLKSGNKSCGKIPELSNEVVFDRNSGAQRLDIIVSGLAKCKNIQAKLPIHFTGNGQILYKNEIDFSKIRFSKKIHFSQLEKTSVRGNFSISAESTDETCYKYCDGTITISISGTPTYPVDVRLYYPTDLQPPDYVDYTNLDSADFPYTISDLCGSSNPYTVRVKDSDDDAEWKGNIYVLAPGEMIIADADTTNETCSGYCDGGVEINFIQNAVYPVSYQWTDGETIDSIGGKCAGTYSVTVTDDHSCVDTFDFPITAPPAITIDSTYYTPYICAGDSGQVYVEASGGTSPLSYDIGNGSQEDGDFPGLSSGTYTVTVTDNNSCTDTAGPFDLQDNPPINISDTHNNVDCNGNCTGSIDVTVSGGNDPYIYSWTGPNSYSSTSEDLSGLCAGVYDLTVTDSVNCTETYSVTITEPDPLTITNDSTVDISCNGAGDGKIYITISGGTSPYTFDWEGPNGYSSANEDITNLEQGIYSVTVTDSSNCTATFSDTINEPLPINITTDSVQDISCNGQCDGAIYITVTNGTPSYTYNWTGPSGYNSTNENISNLCAGDYDLTVTDTNGCQQTNSETINEPSALNVTETHVNPKCNSDNNGSIDLTVSGGTPGYSFNWSTSDGSGLINGQEDQDNLTAGTYDVTVSDVNGCQQILSIVLSDPLAIIITETHNNISCNGLTDGSIDLTVTGGTGPGTYVFDWSTSDGSGLVNGQEDQSGLGEGTYYVAVTDTGPCSAYDTITIIEPAGMSISIDSIQDITCNGQCNGSIDITVTGGTTPYTFDWQGSGYSSTNEDISDLCAGTYYLTVTDSAECKKSDSATVTEPPVLNVTETHVNPKCNSDNNGSIDLTVSGGTPGYSFNWNTSDGSGLVNGQEDQDNLTAGTYDVTVSDVNGCQQILSIVLSDPLAIIITETHNNISCNGLTDGSIDLTVTGGTGPGTYVFDWSTSDGSGLVNGQEDQSGLGEGTYYVAVTDTGPCSAYDTITIIEPAGMSISIDSIQDIPCNGQCNGSIDITVTGATTPYTFDWEGPNGYSSTNEDISSLCGGTYDLIVTDSNNCSQDTSIVIDEPSDLIGIISNYFEPLCNGDCNGQATVTALGGTPSYSYSWSTGGNSTTENGLCAGKVVVTVTDDHGCTVSDSVTLNEPPVLNVTVVDTTDPLCYNSCDGSITISADGGTEPYVYSWSDGATESSRNNLCAGTFQFTVTDDHNCTASDSVTLSDPPQITATLTINNQPLCFGVCNGSITVNPSGGTGDLSYSWSNGDTNQTASSLCAGPDSVTVSDANNCTAVYDTVLTAPVVITIHVDTVVNLLCHGDCNGSASVSASGGTNPHSFLWSTGETDSTENNLCDSLYTVTVTDNNGCQDTTSVHPTAPPALWDTLQYIPPSCNGDANAIAWVVDSGGTAPYIYQWSNASTNDTISNIGAGDYIITITDDHDCSLSDTIIIVEPPVLSYQIISHTNPLCHNDCNGGITIKAIGGTPPYFYNWSNGNTSYSDTNLCSGTYYFTITDSSGCTLTDSLTLNNPPLLTSNMIDSNNVSCYGLCDGYAVVSGVGGTLPYDFLWDANTGNQTADSAINLCAGQYFVTVTDTNGCQAIDSILITQPDSIIITVDTVTKAYCGGCVGSIVISVTGGTLPYNYTWSGTSQTSDSITGLCPDIYIVTVTDTNSCTQTNTIEVIDTSDLNLTFSNVHDVSCNGLCDATATASVTGGHPPYTFIWSEGTTDSVATDLCADTFFVTVTDTASCSRVGMIIIDQPNTLSATDSSNNISCHGLTDGSIYLHPTGGIQPYFVVWNNSSTDTILTGLGPGYYTYTITDSNNCTYVDSIEIINPSQLADSLFIINSITCNGYDNGVIGAIPSGGTSPYGYLWTDLTTDSIDSGLVAGTYYLTLTDTNGCFIVDSIILTQPDSLLGNFTSINPPPCGGTCSGSATIMLSGGTSPYSYSWSNGDTTATADSMCVDIFVVTVTDAKNCQLVDSIIMQDTSTLNLVLDTIISPTCYGDCDGQAIVSASGGYPSATPPYYTYQWDANAGNQTDSNAINLCVGNYVVTVTDDNLCSRVLPVSVTQPDSITIQLADTNLFTCYGDSSGTITVMVTGGTPGYSYQWGNGQTDSVATGLSSGIHTVTVTDTLGCVQTFDTIINTNAEILDSITTSNSLCENNTNDGKINLFVSGGTPGYAYLWSTGDTIQNLDSLFGGWYTVTITDTLGCTKIDSGLISGSIVVTAKADTDTIICPGDSVQIFGSGSEIFVWTPTSYMSDSTIKNPIVFPPVTTTYYFTAYDSICFDIDSVLIQVYPTMNIDAGKDVEIMYDHPTQLEVTSEDSAFSYLWVPSDGLNNDTIANPIANPEQTTTYHIFVTNSNGCMFEDSVKVTVIPRLIVPNGITPNGDGINDVWIIDNINRFPDCEVFIFNRWGEQLFYSKGYPDDERWDGTYKGKNLPTGTYYFVINLHDNIITDPITGPITIVR